MLILRDIKNEDLDFLYNIENNQEYMIYGDYHDPYSMDVLQEYIANASTPLFISSQYRYVIDNDEIAVGFLDLFEYNAQDESAFARKTDGIEKLQKWDNAYYSELLKKQCFEIDDAQLKPYFKLENVIDGAFQIAKKLFGLQFEKTLFFE